MPYILINTQIRLENGPTLCGDSDSDPKLMEYLQASLVQQLGNPFAEYRSSLPPRQVLNLLEKIGYNVVGTCGVAQTCVWTCFKPEDQTKSNFLMEDDIKNLTCVPELKEELMELAKKTNFDLKQSSASTPKRRSQRSRFLKSPKATATTATSSGNNNSERSGATKRTNLDRSSDFMSEYLAGHTCSYDWNSTSPFNQLGQFSSQCCSSLASISKRFCTFPDLVLWSPDASSTPFSAAGSGSPRAFQRRSMTIADMLSLPDPAVRCILSYLDIKTRMSLRMVCQDFCNGEKSIWFNTMGVHLQNLIEHCYPVTKRCIISYARFQQVTSKLLQQFEGPSLLSLQLSQPNYGRCHMAESINNDLAVLLNNSASKWQGVTNLDLTGCTILEGGTLSLLAVTFPSVSVLRISPHTLPLENYKNCEWNNKVIKYRSSVNALSTAAKNWLMDLRELFLALEQLVIQM